MPSESVVPAAESAVSTPLVYVSILSRVNMGDLSLDSFEVPGEAFFTALVTDPTRRVSQLFAAPTWAEESAVIASELAACADVAGDTPEQTLAKKVLRKPVKERIPAIVAARFSCSDRVSAACLGRQVIGVDFDHCHCFHLFAIEGLHKINAVTDHL